MKKNKENTEKLRRIVLKLMREHADRGEWIGLANPDVIRGLCNSLEKDPSQWFAAGMQLVQTGFIDNSHWEVLRGSPTTKEFLKGIK